MDLTAWSSPGNHAAYGGMSFFGHFPRPGIVAGSRAADMCIKALPARRRVRRPSALMRPSISDVRL